MGAVTSADKVQRRERVLVSACLLGVACRYDGQSCPETRLRDLVSRGRAIPICPEMAGGLPVPRRPAEIEGAHAGLDGNAVLEGRTRVLREDGVDVTALFLDGARAALALAQELGIQLAILKACSPSCGVGHIYDGRFGRVLVEGDGVTAALLKRAGIQAINERDLSEGEG